MRFLSFLIIFLLSASPALWAQFAPRAGEAGSTAIHKDSSIIKGWASGCFVQRGYQDISQPDSGYTSVGNAEAVAGSPSPSSVSLGDGGMATVTFDYYIKNDPGPDVVVFENGFQIIQNHDSDFLELAFVEVSSDGINFFRFPAQSAADTQIQVGTFDGSKAYLYHNLAGKYTALYGVPFDLEELKDEPGLDVNRISHVRMIDVVGSLNDSFASRDVQGRKINDPWPTPFPQGGFDLSAVGILSMGPACIKEKKKLLSEVYPNPLKAGKSLHVICENTQGTYRLCDSQGVEISSGNFEDTLEMELKKPGIYFLHMYNSEGLGTEKIIVQ